MPNIKIKKLVTCLFVLSVATIGFYIYSEIRLTRWDDHLSPKRPQDDTIHATTTYQFDSNTILTDLKNGRGDIFKTGVTNSNIPPLPSNSFLWKGEDFLAVAEAVHELEWKESLSDWHLYSLMFSIVRCQRVEEGIDSAEVLYYQRQGNRYVVHGMWINPLFNDVVVGKNQYPYREEWTPIELDKLIVRTPTEALKLAEAGGGRDAREKQNETNCYISIYLNPHSLSPSLATIPFKLFGLSWEIRYRGDNGNIFTDSIDPYTGK